MTISTQQSFQTFLGNGATNTFDFSFVGVDESDITVSYIDDNGNTTILNSSQYTIFLNPASPGALWGVGGTVTYPIVGSPIADGTSITITRTLPLTQTTSISNQGDFYPQAIESALDTLEMQIQQVAGRTGAWRGIWVTNTQYSVGDIVIDGANGANTNNFYMCTLSNLSGVWSADLAAGDWTLAFDVSVLGPVSSVSGTANRITVTNGNNAAVVDIASTYAGQNSITTLGTVATGTWSATAIGASKGGTGLTSITAHNLLVGNGTSPATLLPPSSTVGLPLISQGASADPTYGAISAAGGGTGQTSYTDGQLLIGNSSGNTLTKNTLTAGSNITITNGGGTITIAASSSPPATNYIKAWVNFNGTGVVAIRDSFNVSSITDDGTGLYTVNFSSPLANANYAALITCDNNTGSEGTFANILFTGIYTTNAMQLIIHDKTGSAPADATYINVVIVGD